MNQYFRAIGFSDPPKRKEMYNLIEEGIQTPAYRAYTTFDNEEECLLAQFNIALSETSGEGNHIGITVCGQFDENDEFFPEYFYPYLSGMKISTREESSVEKRIDSESYAGVCDDMRVGVTLIYRLHNIVEYVKNTHVSFAPMANTSICLTALSLDGIVMLPIYKSDADRRQKKNTEIKRRQLMNAAKSGDEAAMKELSIAEMDTYANVLSHIQYEDVYTLVDSYFMPYGAECDLYSVMGEIRSCHTLVNRLTLEKVYVMTIDSNGLQFDVAILAKDLYGEPKPGRRFKGTIWLQGRINFPTDVLSLDPVRKNENG